MTSNDVRKLRPPGLPADLVSRPRVDDLLQACFSAHDVIEVAAAPGSGKTTAAQLFAARYGWRTAWLDIDPRDRSARRLLVCIADALAPFADRAPAIAREALRSGLSASEAATVLAEHLEADDLLLVLDNCEELAASASSTDVVIALLTYLPVSARVLLLSRTPLDRIVGKIALDGRVARVTGTDLAFEIGEAELLLAAAGRTEEDAAEVVRQTGGWVTGIVFEGPAATVLGGDLAEYLDEQILSTLDEDEQLFLLRTSMLRAVTPAAARRLAGPEGVTLLTKVRRRRLPGTVGPAGELIHHPRFRQYLLQQLARRLPAATDELERIHAGILIDQGDVEEAVEHLLDLDAVDDAAIAASRAVERLYERADWHLALSWLDRLGPRGEAEPQLVGARIRAYVHLHRTAEAQALVRDLHHRGLLADIVAADPGLVAHLAWAFLWHPAEALELLDHYPCDHRAEAIRYAIKVSSGREPATPPPGTDFEDAQRILHLGLWIQGDLEALARAYGDLDAWPPTALSRAPSTNLLLCLVWEGRGPVARRCWDRVPPEVRDGSHADLWRNVEAWILLSEARPAEALAAGQASVELGRSLRSEWQPYLQIVVGLALTRLGRLDEARDALTASSAASRSAGQQAYVEWAQLYLGLADLLAGRPHDALANLRTTADGMQAAGRRLVLPWALFLLAEAERQAGSAERAREAGALAEEVAIAGGLRFPLEQARLDVARLHPPEPPTPGVSSAPTDDVDATTLRRVEVRTFGPRPDILVDGVPCGVRRLKVIELAAYLAAQHSPVPRRLVQSDLFPDHDRRAGGNYFRQVIHQLRRCTGISVERRADDTIAIEPGVRLFSTDTEIERLLRSVPTDPDALRELAHAVGHADGPYLAASSLPWSDERRFEIDVLLSDALLECAEIAFRSGRTTEAERLAERILSNDPYAERAFQLLDGLAASSGAPERRAIVYERARAAMSEIGMTPEDIGLDRRA